MQEQPAKEKTAGRPISLFTIEIMKKPEFGFVPDRLQFLPVK